MKKEAKISKKKIKKPEGIALEKPKKVAPKETMQLDIEQVLPKAEKNETKVEKKSSESVEKVAQEKKIGEIIRDVRISKKLEIADVSDKLKIRKIYLNAIENSDYNELPCFPYGVGFLKSYAEFLGLDGEVLADQYKREAKLVEKNNLKVIDDGDIVNDSAVPSKKYLIISIVAVVVIYFGWLLINKYYSKPTIEDAPVVTGQEDVILDVEEVYGAATGIEVIDVTGESQIQDGQVTLESSYFDESSLNKPADVQGATLSEEVVIEQPEVPLDPKAKLTGKGIEVLMNDQVWFEAKDYDKLYVSKEFKKGDYYKVPNRSNMFISAGKFDGVDVYIDGKLTKVFTSNKKTNVSVDLLLEQNNH